MSRKENAKKKRKRDTKKNRENPVEKRKESEKEEEQRMEHPFFAICTLLCGRVGKLELEAHTSMCARNQQQNKKKTEMAMEVWNSC